LCDGEAAEGVSKVVEADGLESCSLLCCPVAPTKGAAVEVAAIDPDEHEVIRASESVTL
jgi:hypothetical protein